ELSDHFFPPPPFIVLHRDLKVTLEEVDHRQIRGRLPVRDRKRLQQEAAALRGELEFVNEPRLPHPRLADHRDDLTVASPREIQPLSQRLQLPLPPGEP